MEIEKGDYVLATKYSDGDPGDHWALGFFDSMLPKVSENRYMVIDNEGNQLRGNGFRRIGKISRMRGEWLLRNKEVVEGSRISLWFWHRACLSTYEKFGLFVEGDSSGMDDE